MLGSADADGRSADALGDAEADADGALHAARSSGTRASRGSACRRGERRDDIGWIPLVRVVGR
jgi:hypothetical protein